MTRAPGIFRRLAGLARRAPEAAPAVPSKRFEIDLLKARALSLQAQAASGSKGCTAIRRELHTVRHAILALELQP